ncbi:MAG: hypothetical protein Q9165_000108 [Trypethelium subeluteriae]
MEGSSKVTVEYDDPDGLFSLLSEQLQARLPLRNLNWKSPSRPLRSIDALHVELAPTHEQQNHGINLTVPGTAGAVIKNVEARQKSTVALPSPRRHQIPGLHQTPYLRIYLLRCDDKEVYKANARKQLRDWVKEHTPPSHSASTSQQENHDAFEWLILHVIVPDTAAANEPRFSSTSNNSNNASDKSSSSSRWTGKGSSTIYERLKTDFNESGKNAADRVAQVRLSKTMAPPPTIPSTNSTVPSYEISPQEQEQAWDDFIVKMKALILMSFDLRVAQYEEDIREREAQRSLPGWNFCTFFLLKEGLARGFESVGLVDDALVGYDELSVGLDMIIRDQASDAPNNQAASFLKFAEDLKDLVKETSSTHEKGQQATLRLFEQPLSPARKDYRELILSNNISVFDFECYIFSRQMALLLRRSNIRRPSSKPGMDKRSYSEPPMSQRISGQSSSQSLAHRADETEDLGSLIELCTRALSFIPASARAMREDLNEASTSEGCERFESTIENIVSSWIYAVVQQVLSESATASLPAAVFQDGPDSSSSAKSFSHGKQQDQKGFPARTSSLQSRRSGSTEPPWANVPATSLTVFDSTVFDGGPRSAKEKSAKEKSDSIYNLNLEQLAAHRAELYLLQRRVLEQAGSPYGWLAGWSAISGPQSDKTVELSEVELDTANGDHPIRHDEDTGKLRTPSESKGLGVQALFAAVQSLDAFRALYISLSERASKHCSFARLPKMAEQVLGDLAALKFETGDYAMAAAYFQRIAPLYAEDGWSLIEVTMLKTYAHCLKILHRRDEYARVLLNLLAKAAAMEKSCLASQRKQVHSPREGKPNRLDDEGSEFVGQMTELVNFSSDLPYKITVSMNKYFDAVRVDPTVHHFPDKDGFEMQIKFRYLFDDDLDADAVKLRLVSTAAGQMRELWLHGNPSVRIKKGERLLWLGTNVSTLGHFSLERLIIEAKKVVFVHEFAPKPAPSTTLKLTTSSAQLSANSMNAPRILCYPRSGALDVTVALGRFIYIDKTKTIEVTIHTADNEIRSLEVRLRAGSAGLRLDTNKAKAIKSNIDIHDKSDIGTIKFANIPANTTLTIQVPYDIETSLREICIRPEATYVTDRGEFHFLGNATISVELPLDVNVFDVFKEQALFSKFTVRAATRIPLQLLSVELQQSSHFVVASPSRSKSPSLVFPRGPASFTYKIVKADSGLPSTPETPLILTIKYRCMDEDILERVEELFRTELDASSIADFAPILLPTLRSKMISGILDADFERAAMLNIARLGSFEEMGWSEIIASLPKARREVVSSWLQKWHDKSTIELKTPLDSDYTTSHPPRTIIIAVDVPTIQVLHTASLSLPNLSSPNSAQPPLAAVGQAVRADLHIRHTRHWDRNDTLASTANLSHPSDPLDFVYEIHANPDIWLLGGERRAHFSSREGETKTFALMLIPLVPGRHLLPRVEIRARGQRPRGEEKSQQQGLGREGGNSVSCETDYQSQAQTVMVIADVKGTTVEMRVPGQGESGAVLVGSEQRRGEVLRMIG